MILGPDDPRAITGKKLDEARRYTERFNRDVLGLAPLTPKQKADKAMLLDSILDAIGWSDREDLCFDCDLPMDGYDHSRCPINIDPEGDES